MAKKRGGVPIHLRARHGKCLEVLPTASLHTKSYLFTHSRRHICVNEPFFSGNIEQRPVKMYLTTCAIENT